MAGVALQSYLSSLREMKVWKWERRTRWDENKLEICTSFLVHLNKCAYEISMYAAVLDEMKQDPSSPEALQRLCSYRSANDELRRSHQLVHLAMSHVVITHANEAYTRLRELRELSKTGCRCSYT